MTCSTAFFRIHCIVKIRRYLSQDTAKTTVHAYIISLLDDRICSAFCPRLFTRQESMSLHRYSAVYNGPLSASELFLKC